ncbi:MAG: UvrB/UvrC motif-containing protein, partial [Dysgonomonadaceae bacterium]|nr:UvrB/UvrC motif-containing protein [Dysgonamonadaceae bacterium]
PAQPNYASEDDLKKQIEKTRKAMLAAAKKLEFLEAAQLRDQLIMLEDKLKEEEKIKHHTKH